MEYVYSAMLLHSAKKEIKEDAVSKVLESAGIKVDSARVKALVASLKDVNIDEAIEKAAVAPQAAPQAAPQGEGGVEKAKEEKPKEDKKTQEEAAEGLGSLFG